MEFRAHAYLMAMGSKVRTLEPGAPLGEGLLAACPEAPGDVGEAGSVEVFEVPGVPVDQAVIVGGPDKEGTLYLAAEHPAVVDSDLADLLAQMQAAWVR